MQLLLLPVADHGNIHIGALFPADFFLHQDIQLHLGCLGISYFIKDIPLFHPCLLGRGTLKHPQCRNDS